MRDWMSRFPMFLRDADKGAGGGAADAGKGAADAAAAAAAGADKGAAADKGAGDGKAADATLLADAGKDAADKGDGKQAVPATWPEDWRDKLSGKDEKLAKRLGRFQSPENLFKSYIALEQRMSSGELKTALPENATEAQVAEWRKDNGIPAEPAGYLEKLPDGIVVGEDDKKLVTDFATAMHKVNAPPAVVAQAIDWHYKFEEAVKADQAEADQAFRQEQDDALRAEFGAEYRANVNGVKSFLGKLPDGLADDLLGARLANGQLLGNDGRAIRWLLNMAKEIDPAATVVPGAGARSGEAVDTELANLQKLMADPRSDYWKGPNAERNQARYLELLTARDRMKSRAA